MTGGRVRLQNTRLAHLSALLGLLSQLLSTILEADLQRTEARLSKISEKAARAVAKGDFDTRLPLPARDEMGFLVHSFNDMISRLESSFGQIRQFTGLCRCCSR